MALNPISDYHFLASALPPIHLGDPLELSFNEFDFLLKINLSPFQKKQTAALRRLYDIENLRYFWMNQDLSSYGNLKPNELEEAIISGIGIPDYVYDFVQRFEEKKDRLKNLSQLFSQYFAIEIKQSKGFVRKYLKFERGLRLVFTALRAKQLGRDIMKELQFEDPNDDLVAQIISQKDAKSYEPPSEYESLKALYEANAENPTLLYQSLVELRFQTIETMLGVDVFSIDRINGYMIQLIIAEKWLELDKQKGLEILDSLVREAS